MILTLLNSMTKIINVTTTEIIESEIHRKAGNIVAAFVNSSADAFEDVLLRVKDFTKEQPPPGP
jgi:hypothetical protein